jgi:uncharacterized repeat protein (TIGR03803 family)
MTVQRFQNFNLSGCLLVLALAAFGVSNVSAQSYADLHDFDTPLLASPQYSGILAQGRDGNFYGTAPLGGASGRGGIFSITPTGAYSVIQSFDSTMANPYSGLTLGTDGNFYGTTYNGGASLFGTLFKISPAGVVTTLHSFAYIEGAGPMAPPIQGLDGNFYGTTSIGGAGYGAVYKFTAAGVLTTLYSFDNTHGSTPIAPLILATDGSFYGTTKVGGTLGFGTAFKITPAGALSVLYNFDLTHGSNIYSPLVQGKDGSFYGTARNGGTLNNGGLAFKLTPARVLTVLHNFNATTSTGDGTLPYAGLVQAADGSFYGVTSAGGTNGAGTLYRITLSGSYSTLYSFASATGSLPYATLKQHTNGKLYGEATTGGVLGHGALFSFDAGFGPFINVQPPAAKVGQSIGITGGGFTGATNVFIASFPSQFTVVSDSYISAILPPGGILGPITVRLASTQEVSTLVDFRVLPTIGSVTPNSGAVGTSVVIVGTSFINNGQKGVTKVTFGGGKAAVFSVDNWAQITATVPAGAVTGKIQVTTLGGTATSSTVFTVN